MPIFEKGNLADPNIYCPIALNATMSKLTESVIKDQMVQLLVDRGLTSKHQQTFKDKPLYCFQSTQNLHDWLCILVSSCQTRVNYIDFTKAFDCIVTSELIFKPEMHSITGQPLRCIEALFNEPNAPCRYWLLFFI
jgi:hypothetical protein